MWSPLATARILCFITSGVGSIKGYEAHDLVYGPSPGFYVENGQERMRRGGGGHLGSCKMVLSTASLCNGKDGEKWTGLRYILKVESRVADGLVGRESEKLRRTPRFSVHVAEGGWWCRFPDEEEWRRAGLGGERGQELRCRG